MLTFNTYKTNSMPNRNFIMIVDDDEDDRDLFCEAVSVIAKEIKCLGKQSGEDAIKYLTDDKTSLPDIIFLDLNMPRLDGKTCLKEFKQLNRVKEIPVVIYSTSNHPIDREQTKLLGATGFVQKHTEFQKLTEELRKWLA